jgi:hypothetical protein
MAIDSVGLRTSIINLLSKNNTTTSNYDLSSGLNQRVKTIKKGHADRTAIPNHLYPAILVSLATKGEELNTLGQGAIRDHTYSVMIEPITQYNTAMSQGAAEDENIQLADNIGLLIRNKITLSNTVQYVDTVEIEYAQDIGTEQYINYVSPITVNVVKLSS